MSIFETKVVFVEINAVCGCLFVDIICQYLAFISIHTCITETSEITQIRYQSLLCNVHIFGDAIPFVLSECFCGYIFARDSFRRDLLFFCFFFIFYWIYVCVCITFSVSCHAWKSESTASKSQRPCWNGFHIVPSIHVLCCDEIKRMEWATVRTPLPESWASVQCCAGSSGHRGGFRQCIFIVFM